MSTQPRATCVVFMGVEKSPTFLIEHCPAPSEVDLAVGEILLRLTRATICGSDLHTLDGKRKEAVPSILGHEGVGEIVLSQRAGFEVGDRVTFSICDSCRTCDSCRYGLPQKCSSLMKYGHAHFKDGFGLSGCYSSHLLVREGTHVVKLPPSISDSIAVPINCALATMVSAVDAATHGRQFLEHKSALIQGSGLLGIYGCALLREAGFKVYCTDVNPDRLKMAARFNAIPLTAEKVPLQEEEYDLEPGSVDIVIEACGHPGVIQRGLRALRPGGVYVLAGLVHPDSHLSITGEQIIRQCITIIGIHNYAPHHLEEAVEFLTHTLDKYPYKDLVSPAYTLSDFQAAVTMARTQRFIRVSLDPSH